MKLRDIEALSQVAFLIYSVIWLQNMVYYKMSHVDGRISNPEQRIASDIPRFCSELSDLVQEDLIAVTDGLLYTWRLCSYASPKYILWIMVAIYQLILCIRFSFNHSVFFLVIVITLLSFLHLSVYC